jgi:hypothetical protein
MPVILRYKGYKFYFFSNEGNPPEPLHIHVRKGGAIAKFWLVPRVSVADSYDMTSGELKELAQVVEANHKLIERSWDEFFGKQAMR